MMSFHLRTTPPSTTRGPAEVFDAQVARVFSSLTSIPEAELRRPRVAGVALTSALAQAQLPGDAGGFGLRQQAYLALIAYLGSLCQCLAPLRAAFPALRGPIDSLAEEREDAPPAL